MELSFESMETPAALTKAQLAELLFEQIGLNKRESKDMIDAFFDLIADSLVERRGRANFWLRQLSDTDERPPDPVETPVPARPFPLRREGLRPFMPATN